MAEVIAVLGGMILVGIVVLFTVCFVIGLYLANLIMQWFGTNEED